MRQAEAACHLKITETWRGGRKRAGRPSPSPAPRTAVPVRSRRPSPRPYPAPVLAGGSRRAELGVKMLQTDRDLSVERSRETVLTDTG